MTNREHMINLLLDGLDEEPERVVSDDDGASEEAMIYYNINCPYLAVAIPTPLQSYHFPTQGSMFGLQNGMVGQRRRCVIQQRGVSNGFSLFVSFLANYTYQVNTEERRKNLPT
ncbi:MAG: hypothetical protein ACLTX3_08590 [Lachnospiraceae bacterium]